MQKRLLFLLALPLLLLVASGCDTSTDGLDDPYERGDTDVLVPLEVDNSWTYRTGEEDNATAAVEGTATRNDTTYYLAGHDLGALYNGDDGLYTAEYSENNDGSIDIDPPTLFFKYPTEDGESYTYKGRTITVQRGAVTVPADTFEDAYIYSYEDFGQPIETAFAPGVGFIRIAAEGSAAIEFVSNDLAD